MLDYGDSVKLGEPAVLQLEISNPTAIPTSYEAHVTHFPPAKPPTPPTQPMPSTYSVCNIHVIPEGRQYHIILDCGLRENLSSI